MNLLNLLIIIFTQEENYVSTISEEPEMYKYLITPFNDTMFTLNSISDGSLLVRLNMITCLIQIDDNTHLFQLLTYNLLKFLGNIMEVEEMKENSCLSKNEVVNKLEDVQIEVFFIFSNILLSDTKQKTQVKM